MRADFDENLPAEIKKLSQEQLGEVADVLMERDSDPTRFKL